MHRWPLAIGFFIASSVAQAQVYGVHCWTALASGERALISGTVELAASAASHAQVVYAAEQKFRLGSAMNSNGQIEDVAGVIECIGENRRFATAEANRALDRPG